MSGRVDADDGESAQRDGEERALRSGHGTGINHRAGRTHGRGVPAGGVLGPGEQNGHQHKTGAVGRGHEQRPKREIAKTEAHADPSGMTRAKDLEEPEAEEERRRCDAQGACGDARLGK